MPAVLQEPPRVLVDDLRLIWLGDVCKDDIDHWNKHSIALGITGVFDDGDDVGALLSKREEVTANTLGELDGVDGAGRTNDIRAVRNCCA